MKKKKPRFLTPGLFEFSRVDPEGFEPSSARPLPTSMLITAIVSNSIHASSLRHRR